MHNSSRAPVLSATRSRVSAWITRVSLPGAHARDWPRKPRLARTQGAPVLGGSTGVTEDAARRRSAASQNGCELRGGTPALPGLLYDLEQPPALRARERPA